LFTRRAKEAVPDSAHFDTTILPSRADDTMPFTDTEELIRNSGLPESALIEVGNDHRLADEEPLQAMLDAIENTKE
jgi:hypothetical protein